MADTTSYPAPGSGRFSQGPVRRRMAGLGTRVVAPWGQSAGLALASPVKAGTSFTPGLCWSEGLWHVSLGRINTVFFRNEVIKTWTMDLCLK